MSIDEVKQAIKVAEATGRKLCLQQLINQFPKMCAGVLKSVWAVKNIDTSQILGVGKVKAKSGVTVDAKEKVREEVFAMEGTGKNTSINKSLDIKNQKSK